MDDGGTSLQPAGACHLIWGLALVSPEGIALVVCSILAGATGLLIAANSNSAAPTAADGLLLPAFTAAFLGAVVLRESEFNVGGTLIAVLLLTTIDNGLAQSGAAIYVSSIVKGILLVAAVALSGLGRRALAR